MLVSTYHTMMNLNYNLLIDFNTLSVHQGTTPFIDPTTIDMHFHVAASALLTSNGKPHKATHQPLELSLNSQDVVSLLQDQFIALYEQTLVVELSPSGIVLSANLPYCNWLEVDCELVIGQPFGLMGDHIQMNGPIEEFRAAIKQIKAWKGVFKYLSTSGTNRWVELRLKPFLNAELQCHKFVLLGIDVTDYCKQLDEVEEQISSLRQTQNALMAKAEDVKTLNQKLIEAKQELNGRVAALNNAAIVSETDYKGNITYANDLFCRLSGYEMGELISQNNRILKSGHQPDELFVELWRTISSGHFCQGQIKNKAKDGSYYWVQTTITPILDRDNKPVKYISIRFDITILVESGLGTIPILQ
jgi:PAS domain S-box-containing protein